jgi:RNA polymerase sigma factor (sigma-70 family)
MDEKQLIEGCLKGNFSAQKKLYEHYAPLMMGVCMRYASCEAEAEDILQEGFIKVFQKIETFQGTGEIGAWIRKIMVNTALQKYRDTKNLRLHVEVDQFDYMLSDTSDILAQLSAAELRAKIQELPTGFRMVFNLYAVEGYTHPEIAKELGISVGTSKSQYSRARAILRKKIEEDNNVIRVSGQAI